MSTLLTRLAAAASFAVAALSAGSAAAQTLDIQTDSYPVTYFAERIAGPAASVTLPVPADRDPSVWSPSIAAIGAYQSADLILLNGANLAAWTTRATLPRAKIFDTSLAFADQYIATTGVTHSHGPEGEHSHPGTASFTWLDFGLAARQAEAIASELSRRVPASAPAFAGAGEALAADLAALDAEAAAIGAAAAGQPLLASHPRYPYLARAYGFAIESVEWESGETPTEEQLAALDALLATHPAKLMIWEAEPSAEAVAALAQRGVASVVFATAANRPAEGDFLAVMEGNLERLRAAFTGL